MMLGDSLWAFVVIGGFVILLAAILFARRKNETTRVDEARTEAATARMYDEQSNEDRARTP